MPIPKKHKQFIVLKDLLAIGEMQMDVLKELKARKKSLFLDYLFVTTESFLQNAKEVIRIGKRGTSSSRKYAGYNVRTMIEELASVGYLANSSNPDREKFVIDDLLAACLNLYKTEDENGKKTYEEIYNTLNKYRQPAIQTVKMKQLGVNVYDRLIKGFKKEQGERFYGTYGYMSWLPHSNFLLNQQHTVIASYDRTLLLSIPLVMEYIKMLDALLDRRFQSEIEAVQKKHAHLIDEVTGNKK